MPGPDHRTSLEPDEFARDGRGIRASRPRSGRRQDGPAAAERAIAAVARRSLHWARVARRPASSSSTEATCVALRPGTGHLTGPLDRLVGRRTARAVERRRPMVDADDVEAADEPGRRGGPAAHRRPDHRPPGLGDPPVDLRGHPRASRRSTCGSWSAARTSRPRHGHTVDTVRADGFEPDAELAWLGADGRPAGRRPGRGGARRGRGAAPGRRRADALVLAGDRFETAAAALAATVDRVPIVHLHGGEQTLGAFDDALRHAITKLSHLHLVSNEEHARRVIAMGEDPATVHVVGAPGLDAARPAGPARSRRRWRRRWASPSSRRSSSSRSTRPRSTPTRPRPRAPSSARWTCVDGDLRHHAARTRIPGAADPCERLLDGRVRARAGSPSRRSASAATGVCCGSPTRCSATARAR